jgi:signal transduction histidine kinase/ActR/RegA family two-component response regulator
MLNAIPAVITDVYADARIPHDVYRRTFVKSLIMVPVRERDPVAAIGAYWAMQHEASAQEVHVLQTLANAAALALANVELYQDLQKSLEREREARDAAEHGNRTKAELLANISHELRTPLGVIQNFCWQLRRSGVTADLIAHAAEVIERNVAMQTRLVEDLLDASRGASGHLTLQQRLVDVVSACRMVVETARPGAQEKAVSIRFSNGQPVVVWGDPDRLQQVVWNLVNNAIKFTPAGGWVEVLVKRSDNHACIQVSDSGVGISPDVLPHIFERFRQADSSTSRRLGLGLTIARQIVDAHGGSIRAESAGGGHGACFAVELPVPAVLEEPGSWLRRRAGVVPRTERLDGLTVLAVDDEQDALDALRGILEHHGARVLTAASAAEALEVLQQVRPDVLLADLAMPGTDGYQMLQQVRALQQLSGRSIPAAALTAFYGAEHEQAVRAAGYQAYLPKPVTAEELTAIVARLAGTVH